MNEIRPPEESYSDRLQNPEEEKMDRDTEMEEVMRESMVEYERYLADENLRRERDRIEKYSGDCMVQKAVLLMIKYKLKMVEKTEVSEILMKLRDEGNMEAIYRYLQRHKVLPANYIGIFL